MASRKSVQNTHKTKTLRAIHASVVDLVGVMNRPQRDANMIEKAGVSLDRALFPLLVGIGRFGPVGVVEMADRVGRDHTTVSRQIAKLESLGLVERRAGASDKRVREAVVTAKGRAMNDAIDGARDRVLLTVFDDWNADDIETLAVLLRRLADTALAFED